MARYKLHVEETVSRLNFIEIETDLTDREVDLLLSKIEKGEVISAANLKAKLEVQGVKIRSMALCNKPYYMNAETLEIEEVEESKIRGILFSIKPSELSEATIISALEKLNGGGY